MKKNAPKAVQTWRELDGKAKEARSTFNAGCLAHPVTSWQHNALSPNRLWQVSTEIPVLRLEAEAERARLRAVEELDAYEVSTCDALAVARDAKHLLDDLAAVDVEERELQAKLRAVQERRTARLAEAFRADVALAERRADANDPVPDPLPRPMPGVEYMEAVRDRLKSGPSTRTAQAKAEQIERARAEEIRIASTLEEQRQAEEAARNQKEEQRRALALLEETRSRNRDAAARQAAAEANAEAERRRGLADSFIARVFGTR